MRQSRSPRSAPTDRVRRVESADARRRWRPWRSNRLTDRSDPGCASGRPCPAPAVLRCLPLESTVWPLGYITNRRAPTVGPPARSAAVEGARRLRTGLADADKSREHGEDIVVRALRRTHRSELAPCAAIREAVPPSCAHEVRVARPHTATTRPSSMKLTDRSTGAWARLPVVATRTCLRTGDPGRPRDTDSRAARRASARRRIKASALATNSAAPSAVVSSSRTSP
jgi:hypothetical protein